MDEDRIAFEAWAAAKDFDIRRISEDAELWPGVYMKNHVHLMWLAWQAASENERAKYAAGKSKKASKRGGKTADTESA